MLRQTRGGESSRSRVEVETIGRLDWIKRLNGQSGGNWVLKRGIFRF